MGFGPEKERPKKEEKPKPSPSGSVLIIDVAGLIHRVWHCGQNAGHPTSTVNWSLHCLAGLIRDYEPAQVIMACEGGNAFRQAIYPPYKTHRPPAPEGLHEQIALFTEACRSIGWPALAASGYEADDVMATVARWYSSKKTECVIATGDKDMRQLLALPHIRIIDTRLAGGEIDAAHVMRRFAVKPEQLGDLLALAGDACDGVPGVNRIGEVVAAKLLAEHESLDKLLAWAITQIEDKKCSKAVRMLHAERDMAVLSRKLVELQNCKPTCLKHGNSTQWPKWPIKGWENRLDKMRLQESVFSLVNVLNQKRKT